MTFLLLAINMSVDIKCRGNYCPLRLMKMILKIKFPDNLITGMLSKQIEFRFLINLRSCFLQLFQIHSVLSMIGTENYLRNEPWQEREVCIPITNLH